MIPRTLSAAMLAASLTAAPALADDFLETLDAARAAYEAGDINTAKAEIDFAGQILAQMKAAGLQAFMPQPMEGWTFEAADSGAAAIAFGGGAFGGGTYTDADGNTVEFQLIAGNQLATSMGAMFSNPALLGASGAQVKRIAGQRLAISTDGEITGMIGEIFMQVGGSAGEEAKIAYIEILDIDGMVAADF